MVCVHVFYFLFSYCFRLEAVKWSHIVGLIWFALLWCLVMSSVCSGAYYLLLCLLWGKLFSSGLPSIFELVDLSFHSRASYLVRCMISKLFFILRTEEIAQWAKCFEFGSPSHENQVRQWVPIHHCWSGGLTQEDPGCSLAKTGSSRFKEKHCPKQLR